VGINANDPKAQALLLVCQKYGLDPLLKHVVLVSGNIYVTRDGLLCVAHRSGQLDGIVVEEHGSDQTHFWAAVSVFRKDMSKPFRYVGRYPKAGANKNFGPEMAVKCGEVMALRRAFNVALCAQEERWDQAPPEPVPIPIQARLVDSRPAEAHASDPFKDWLRQAAKRASAHPVEYASRIAKHLGLDCPDGDCGATIRVMWVEPETRLDLVEACRELEAESKKGS
jgi:hypothetical protein